VREKVSNYVKVTMNGSWLATALLWCFLKLYL